MNESKDTPNEVAVVVGLADRSIFMAYPWIGRVETKDKSLLSYAFRQWQAANKHYTFSLINPAKGGVAIS